MSLTIVCHCPDCPRNGLPVKQIDETFHSWIFECPTCKNLRCVSKAKVGGTIGAGRRDDEPALKYIGRGI